MRVSTNTMLITTSMLNSVCATRPARYNHIDNLAERVGLLPGHVLPVVEAHVPGNQRPVADLRAHADDGMGGTDGDSGHVLLQPRAQLTPDDLRSLLVARLGGKAIDQLVELRMLHEQIQCGFRIAPADQD